MQKIKILVVDDDKEICFLIQRFLLREGYQVIIANSGKEALLKFKEKKPQLILLDIRLPQMDGLEVLRRIKQMDKKASVLMITAIKDDTLGRRALELGAFDYITKPLSFEYLKTCLLTKLAILNSG